MKKLIIATFFATVILFIWSGVTQMLPWGIPTTTNVAVSNDMVNRDLQYQHVVPPNTLTTEAFEAQFNNSISTYTTGNTFSWIVMQPLKSDYSGYFIKEILTQL